MRVKLLKWTAAISVLLLTGCMLVVEQILPYSGIKPRRMEPSAHNWRFTKGILPADYGLKSREFSVETADSIRLSGYVLESNQDTTRATIIMLHGIGNCKETQLGRAKMLADAGFASVAVDLRAHGKSTGEYCTFGYCEKYDIQRVVDHLLTENPDRPIGVWGVSLGGAIALQALGIDPRIRFGIVESTFDEFEKVAVEYGADFMLGLRSAWLTHRILAKSGLIANFVPGEVKPVEYARQIQVPVLFIHGDQDDKIPIEFNQRNYAAVPAEGKQWITVPGANHRNVWQKGGPALERQVMEFLGVEAQKAEAVDSY